MNPSLFGGRCNVDWEAEHIPTLSPHPRTKGPPTVRMAVPGMTSGLACSSPLLHTPLVHSPVCFSSLCREMSLSCNPKQIQTHTYGIWRNHWLPKESIKLYFSLSRVCKRHLVPFSLTMGDKHISLDTLAVVMSTLLLLLPVSANVCEDVASPTCNQWLQNKTICSKMCATLFLRSPGLQFRVPLVMESVLSDRVPLPCASFLGPPV